MRPEIIAILHNQLAAAAPIEGISVGDEEDKSSWRIDFKPEATDAQRAAARQIVTGFNKAGIASKKLKPKQDILDILGDAVIQDLISSTSPAVRVWLEKFRAAHEPLDVNDPRVAAAFQALSGLIPAGKIAQILE